MVEKRFLEYINEAKFAPVMIDKVLYNLVKLIEKKIGQNFYRYGGEHGYQEVEIKNHPGKGLGFLYFTQRRLAIRFNFVKGEFVSMNFWKTWSIGQQSDMYIDFGGSNIVRIAGLIIDEIKHALHAQVVKKEIPVYIPESVSSLEGEMIEESFGDPRKDPNAFYQLMRNTYQDKDDDYFKEMHWRDIANAAAMANIKSIPSFVNAQKSPTKKGYYSVVPGATSNSGAGDPILYIKVTAQDPVSKKFLSAADSKAAQDMYTKIQGAISDNSADMAKKEVKDPNTLFGALANLTKLVVKGTNKALLIYGGPGTGKSFTVTNEIKQAGLVKNKDWYHIKGKVTTQSLYQTMFLNRKGQLLVFDDADSVFNTEDSANILKAGLDSYDERIISWLSPRTQYVGKLNDAQKEAFNDEVDRRLSEDPLAADEYDEETGKIIKKKPLKYPSEFAYEGRIIFISNLPEKDIDTAVLSRAFKINMDLTDEQMFMRMESIIEYLGEESLSTEEKLDTLKVLRERHMLGELKSPNMRTFVAASKIRASGIPNWIELLQYS